MKSKLSRRHFTSLLSIGSLATLGATHVQATPRKPLTVIMRDMASINVTKGAVRFGVIADVHVGYCLEAPINLQSFVDAMNAQNVDFIISLGDFTLPGPRANAMNIWRSSTMPRYHVLGNHEMDGSTKNAARKALDMPANYYTFDGGVIKGIVLDGNVRDQYRGGYYASEMGREQVQWLDNQLAITSEDKPTVLFIHQPFFKTTFNDLADTESVLAVIKKTSSEGSRYLVWTPTRRCNGNG